MADVITCPSGLQGRVRGMKVREERVLADRKLANSGGLENQFKRGTARANEPRAVSLSSRT